jgi:hypothetical protein
MIEQLKTIQEDTPKKRCYVCRYDWEYSAENMERFITSLGKEPEKYEIISLFLKDNGHYEMFYKEYID